MMVVVVMVTAAHAMMVVVMVMSRQLHTGRGRANRRGVIDGSQRRHRIRDRLQQIRKRTCIQDLSRLRRRGRLRGIDDTKRGDRPDQAGNLAFHGDSFLVTFL
jgi:hypothetical protein